MQYSSVQAANYMNVSHFCIYYAIKSGKLKFNKIEGRYFFDKEDLDKYSKNRWKRVKPLGKYNMSISEVAEYLMTTVNRVHYLIKKGDLKAEKIKGKFFINPKDIDKNL